MAEKDLSSAEMRDRLWKELEKARIVPLGPAGGAPHHMQPMAAFGDRAREALAPKGMSSYDLALALAPAGSRVERQQRRAEGSRQ